MLLPNRTFYWILVEIVTAICIVKIKKHNFYKNQAFFGNVEGI